MKVLCIDDALRPCDFPGLPNVTEGCIYTVYKTCKGRGADGTYAVCYKLEEFKAINSDLCWDVDRFVPLSDIDESTMERNYKFKAPVSEFLN